MAPSTPKKPTKGANNSSEPLHSAASKDIWLASLGAMAQAQAAAQEQIHEAALCRGSLELVAPLVGFLGVLGAIETPNFWGLTGKASL